MVRNTRHVRIVNQATGEVLSSGVWSHDLCVGDKVSAAERSWKVRSVEELNSPIGMRRQEVLVERVQKTKVVQNPKPAWRPLKLETLQERHRKEELDLVIRAMDAADWNLSAAGKLIGTTWQMMKTLIKRHRLHVEWRKRRP